MASCEEQQAMQSFGRASYWALRDEGRPASVGPTVAWWGAVLGWPKGEGPPSLDFGLGPDKRKHKNN